jgi:hypothetical protein
MLHFRAQGLCVNFASSPACQNTSSYFHLHWRHRHARVTTTLPGVSLLLTCFSMEIPPYSEPALSVWLLATAGFAPLILTCCEHGTAYAGEAAHTRNGWFEILLQNIYLRLKTKWVSRCGQKQIIFFSLFESISGFCPSLTGFWHEIARVQEWHVFNAMRVMSTNNPIWNGQKPDLWFCPKPDSSLANAPASGNECLNQISVFTV